MTNIPDYYATLHVPRDATQQQISRAYRALMRSHHPDLEAVRGSAGPHMGDAGTGTPTEGELLRIMHAFDVLRDPALRAAYDGELRAVTEAGTARDIPVRKVRHTAGPPGNIIRISPVHWESGPWA
ncbi:MAG: J domain-containing protein [Arthrobacter sp.]